MSDGYWHDNASGPAGRRLRRRGFLGALGAGSAGMAALAAGCSSSNNNNNASGSKATTASTAAATAASAAATKAAGGSPAPAAAGNLPAAGQGGVLRGHDNGDPASFDLIKTWAYRTMMPSSMTYPRLLKYVTKPGTGALDYLVTTDLAASMPEQPDSMTYIFKLQPAKWENKAPLNGRALTADDIVKNWARFSTEHPNRTLMADVQKVEAVDPSTVKFTLSKPLGPFIAHIGYQGNFYIQPYELFGTGKLEKDMWSAGPFIFKGYDVGSKVSFERNPDYFVKDRPLLSKVEYDLIPDASTTISALRSKQIDTLFWSGIVGPRDVDSLKKDLPDATFLPYPRQGNEWIGMDLGDPRFQDKRVRQAISMAMNRDDQVKVYGEGQWVLPWGYLSQYNFDAKKNEFPNAKYYQYNLAEAKKLLDAAGFKSNDTFDQLASAVWTKDHLQVAQLAQEELKAIGINTNIKVLEFAEVYAKTTVAGTWSGGFAQSANLVGTDPNDYLSVLWQPESPRLLIPNFKSILAQDTELLNLIEAQRRELNVDKRKAVLKDVVNVMADRMYNIPLVIDTSYHVHRSNVKNLNWIFTYAQGSEYLFDSYVQGA